MGWITAVSRLGSSLTKDRSANGAAYVIRTPDIPPRSDAPRSPGGLSKFRQAGRGRANLKVGLVIAERDKDQTLGVLAAGATIMVAADRTTSLCAIKPSTAMVPTSASGA